MIKYAAFLLMLLAGAGAAAAPAPAPSPAEIVAAAPAADWEDIAPEDLMVMTLANGATATIQLVRDFAPVHVANIRKLAAAQFWDGTSINRVQENYVVQWGDASEKKPLPAGLGIAPAGDYTRPLAGLAFRALPYPDPYAKRVGHAAGWPVASDGKQAWLPHCFGMIGVGRNLAPDTGSGAELYVVNGHAPRHLDRNIAVVGRVIDGIGALTALPRGTGALGFYEKPEERTAIASIRAGSEQRWQMMRSGSASFGAYAKARANRRDPFFNIPAGGADICNQPVPIRKLPAG
jgi:peptidylprolyl isomerase